MPVDPTSQGDEAFHQPLAKPVPERKDKDQPDLSQPGAPDAESAAQEGLVSGGLDETELAKPPRGN